jgi:hypothetical protein
MTLTLEPPPQAEAKLSEEAARAGLPMDQYALRVLMDKVASPADRIRRLAMEIAGPGTHQYMEQVVYAADVTGWHAATTQNPWIMERLRKDGELAGFAPGSPDAQARAEQVAEIKRTIEAGRG